MTIIREQGRGRCRRRRQHAVHIQVHGGEGAIIGGDEMLPVPVGRDLR